MIPTAILRNEFTNHAQHLVERAEFMRDPGLRQADARTRRTTYQFGYIHPRLIAGDFSFTPLPRKVKRLRDIALSAVREFGLAEIPIEDDRFTNVMVSHYCDGDKLQPHIDVDAQQAAERKYGFYYGPTIIGFVIQAAEKGGLFLCDIDADRANLHAPSLARTELAEQDGLVYVLNGSDRLRGHGVSPIRGTRLSLTLRTVEFI